MKKYRFFYHFYKQKKCMTVHFRGQCIPVKDVECLVACETKWGTKQPFLVMQGFASEIVIKNGKAIIR